MSDETGNNSKSYSRIITFLFLLLFFFVHICSYVYNSGNVCVERFRGFIIERLMQAFGIVKMEVLLQTFV